VEDVIVRSVLRACQVPEYRKKLGTLKLCRLSYGTPKKNLTYLLVLREAGLRDTCVAWKVIGIGKMISRPQLFMWGYGLRAKKEPGVQPLKCCIWWLKAKENEPMTT